MKNRKFLVYKFATITVFHLLFNRITVYLRNLSEFALVKYESIQAHRKFYTGAAVAVIAEVFFSRVCVFMRKFINFYVQRKTNQKMISKMIEKDSEHL